MPNNRDVARTSGSVSVATSSTVVATANPSREKIIISNDGANVVYLAFSTVPNVAPTATANNGIRLAAAGSAGSSWEGDAYIGAIAGIALTGATVVTVMDL